MKKKDPNSIAKLEKAISERYGEETIQHPKKNWNEQKERQYLEDLKKLYASRREDETPDKVEINGVFVASKLINNDSNRSCPVCNTYSYKSRDDVYMTKFDCCEKCYIQWVEGREERWKTGWRPNK
tara:strand:- start:3437 stop:3814 length:378 start_codon:yes stop_codon:yes gene_type:complete